MLVCPCASPFLKFLGLKKSGRECCHFFFFQMADADSDGQASTFSEQKNRDKDTLKGKRKGVKSLFVSWKVYVTVIVW